MNSASRRETGRTTHWHWHDHGEVSLSQLGSCLLTPSTAFIWKVSLWVLLSHTHSEAVRFFFVLEETEEQHQSGWDSSHILHVALISAPCLPQQSFSVSCTVSKKVWLCYEDFSLTWLASIAASLQTPTPVALKPIPLLPWLRTDVKEPTPCHGYRPQPKFLETLAPVAMAANRTSCCHRYKYSWCCSGCRVWIPCCHYCKPHPLLLW